jgi:hypothetical protein
VGLGSDPGRREHGAGELPKRIGHGRFEHLRAAYPQ